MEEYSDMHLVKNKYCESAVMVNAAGATDGAQGDGTCVLDQQNYQLFLQLIIQPGTETRFADFDNDS
ncbi:MAG: hypothetical protein VYD14_01540 [SAR324 cluster bacterium]|nr:hypothetical protein [SAR324 cluster bacterium]